MSATREIEALVRQLHAHRAALREARLRLADSARDGGALGLTEGSWDWARRILHSRAARLRRFPGVVGYGLGTKVVDGQPTGEACLTVYVRRKLAPAELRARAWRALPAKVGTGPRSIAVDVLAIGDLERHAAPALRPPPGAEPGLAPGVRGASLEASALVERLATGERVAVAGLGPLRGWRPAVLPGDVGEAVRLAGRVSGAQHGVIASPIVHLPGWGIDTALLARIHSVPGDSAAPLVDADDLLLGFLVGRASGPEGNLRVFRPAGFFSRRALVRVETPPPASL